MAMKDKVPAVIQEVKGHNSRPRAALLLRAFPVIISPLSSFFLKTKSNIKVPSTSSLFTQLHSYSYSLQCTFDKKQTLILYTPKHSVSSLRIELPHAGF